MRWRTIGYIVAAAIAIVIALPFLWMANEGRLKRKYEAALNSIEVGDSEERVVELMGQPDQRNWCFPLPTDHDSPKDKQFQQQCYIQYTYVTFMEHYGVSFDKDNRVSRTFYSVSP
jgi:hypothetical protein